MRVFFIKNWQKPVGVFFTSVLLSIFLFKPVVAADSNKSWFNAEAHQAVEQVCPKQRVTLLYSLMFMGLDYEKEMNRLGNTPLPSITHPVIKITTTKGRIENVKSLEDTYKYSPPYDDVIKSWNDVFDFIPDKPGTAMVTIKATYLGAEATDKWEIKVLETCKYDIEIHADQTGVKGEPVEKAKGSWDFIIWVKGMARIIADPIDQGGGSGGKMRYVAGYFPTGFQDNATGTLEYFGDAIWLGREKDTTCWTEGAYTCIHEFTIFPVPGDETIDFQFNITPGQCSGFSVVCSGSGGGGKGAIPPMPGSAFLMNAEIPRSGGNAHYIQQLPYGITMDFLISAFPVEEQ